MNFIRWACLVVHVVSTVVWFGGLIYLNSVFIPVAEHERETRAPLSIAAHRRFLPLVWSSLWSMIFTGILLMLLSPRFHWGDYATLWPRLLAVKQLSFLAVGLFSWQMKRVLEKLEMGNEHFGGWWESYRILLRRTIACALLAIAAATAMSVVD